MSSSRNNNQNHDSRQVNCWLYEKYGHYGKECTYMHRRKMSQKVNNILPENRRLCLNYLYNSFCPNLANCRFMHIRYSIHTEFMKTFVFEINETLNFSTYPTHLKSLVDFITVHKDVDSLTVHIFTRKYSTKDKKVIVLFGESGSGCSTLGNVILWGSDFSEHHQKKYKSNGEGEGWNFKVGWDDVHIVLECSSMEDRSITQIQAESRYRKLIQFCHEKYGGINCIIYVTNLDPTFESTKVLKCFSNSFLDILNFDFRSRFFIFRTHFERDDCERSTFREKKRIQSRINDLFSSYYFIGNSDEQVQVVNNINRFDDDNYQSDHRITNKRGRCRSCFKSVIQRVPMIRINPFLSDVKKK